MEKDHEALGPKFNETAYLQARLDCLEAIENMSAKLFEGMTEKQGMEIIEDELKSRDSKKRWHPNKFRIGVNTTKSFRESSEEDVVLSKGDLVFIDIGPVFGDQEADMGRTYCFGNCSEEYRSLQNAAEKVFLACKEKWETEKLTGTALYDFAEQEAIRLGYELNPKMAGHRLGDFPHALITRESLSKFDKAPKSKLWVLEIHIICPKLNRGAFFEDLLIEQ